MCLNHGITLFVSRGVLVLCIYTWLFQQHTLLLTLDTYTSFLLCFITIVIADAERLSHIFKNHSFSRDRQHRI